MVKKSLDAKVRPVGNPSLEKASLLGAARVYVSKDSLISLTGTLDNGKLCNLERLDDGPSAVAATGDGKDSQPSLQRQASLWVLPDKNLSPNVIVMTRAFQDASGFKLGDQVRISIAEGTVVPDADEVLLEPVEGSEKESEKESRHSPGWEYSASLSLDRAEQVYPGMVIEGVSINKLRRSFKVVSVNSQLTNLARFQLPTTSVRIRQPGSSDLDAEAQFDDGTGGGGELVLKGVPGLTSQVDVINDFLDSFSRPFRYKNQRQSCGFVIHGGPGTGKTFILRQVAETRWGRVQWIKPADKLSTIRETIKLARTQQPSLVFIDALEDLIAKDRSNRDAIIDTIAEELDALSVEASAAGTLPKVVVLVTCQDYMTDVPQRLQGRTRLQFNVALPIPRAPERLEILSSLDVPLKAEERDEILWAIAQKTHAYNGNDLQNLVMNAKIISDKRLRKAGVEEAEPVTREDMAQALRVTRPTAMHDVNLKPPTIHWQDVGGQESLKNVLTQMIRNTKDANTLTSQVLPNPPKGLLLYGPPGCSKTLSAQAMATESSFNFFSVKGAELLNMYVGESERAVRMLFERARAASPSIIFFDEIDSISGQRAPGSGGGGGGGGGASASRSSVNMLTTLLTEMDGFEDLNGVLVLAATNRPEAIDPALLRPGRFDQVLYVGPPDREARVAVFGVHLRTVNVAADIDVAELADMSDGHSGAEIKAACTEAGRAVLDRYYKQELLQQQESSSTTTPPHQQGDAEVPRLEIGMQDLVEALERTPRNITRQMIDGYERWSKQFRKA